MATDPMIARLAQVLVDYSLEIKPGDLFRIRGEVVAEPLMREAYRLAVQRGAYAFVDVALPGLAEIYLKDAPDTLLDYLSPIDMYKVQNITADLAILGDSNTQALSGVNPARMARLQSTRRPLIETFFARTAAPNLALRWVGTLLPTQANAQDAKMSLSDYEKFVYHAMRLDTPDPVAALRDASERQQRWADFLQTRNIIRVVAEDTDISFSTAGRKWVNADGKCNFPDGEVFTGPVEESVNGTVRFTYPTVFAGREAEDVTLTFENGTVTHWTAKRGKELLDELFAMDEGARRLGEFAIGTNENVTTFTKNILFDEKIGGTCHFAIGASIPETGGVNKSALHWDMVCDLRRGGTIYADAEPIQRNGIWLI